MFKKNEDIDFMSRKLLILIGFLMFECVSYSQNAEGSDSDISNEVSLADSVTVVVDTLNTDLESPIFYDAKDSIIYDAINNKVLLYGNGIVKFEDIELTAGYVEYGFDSNTVSAKGKLDSAGVFIQKPVFIQGEETFRPDSLSFNFKTEKAYVSNVVTQNGEFYILSDVTKRDSSEKVYLGKTKITTCDKPNPHFHFQVNRAALVPENEDSPGKIVTGPVMLKFRTVPTPLALPFGYFPDTEKRTKGILMPAYGNGFSLGYFLRDLGYYLPINEYLDTRVLVDLYTRGSWAVKNQTTYKKKYKYSGRFNLSYSKTKSGFAELNDYSEFNDFMVDWSHILDAKAVPGFRFSSSVRLGTSSNFRNNLNSSQTNFLTNTYSSSINATKSGVSVLSIPTTFTLNLRHSQNTTQETVALTLPQFTIQMNRAYPFKSKKVGKKSSLRKAIEGIGVTNTGNFESRAVLDESEIKLNNLGALRDDFSTGYRHQFSASTSLKAGVVSINPTLSFSSHIYGRTKQLSFDPETFVTTEDTLSGLNATYKWNTGVSATTKIFGTFTFRDSKKIKAIRHTLTPRVGFNYAPITGRRQFGFIGENGAEEYYDPAEDGVWGSASNYNLSGALTFNLLNNLEMKVADDEGGTKKVSLLDRFSLSTRKNLAADSLKWSDLTMSMGTRIGQKFNINLNSSYSFYDQDEDGREVDQFLFENNKFLLRNQTLGGGINFSLSGKDFQRKTAKPSDVEEEEELAIENEEELDELNDELDREDNPAANFNVPWNLDIAYTLNRSGGWNSTLQTDTFAVRQGVIFGGSISVGENWRFTAQSGLEIGKQFELTTTTISLYRSLHCWEISANARPFGEQRSWTITLNVKSSTLRDLRINQRGTFGNNNIFRR